MSDRGRLTPVDVVFALATLAVVAALGPVFLTFLDRYGYQANTPTLFLIQMILPLALITFVTVIYTNAVQGVR